MQSRTSEDTLIHNLIREADKRNMLFAKYKSYWIHRETGHSKIRAAREKRRRSQSPATRQGWKRFKRLSKDKYCRESDESCRQVVESDTRRGEERCAGDGPGDEQDYK